MLKWMIYIFEQSVYTHDRMMRHHKSLRDIFDFYWDGNAIILMKLSSLVAVQAVKMTMVLFPLYSVIQDKSTEAGGCPDNDRKAD